MSWTIYNWSVYLDKFLEQHKLLKLKLLKLNQEETSFK